jgi:PAS domain S-box-containing protein
VVVSGPDATVRMASRQALELSGRTLADVEGAAVAREAGVWGMHHPDGVTPARPEQVPLTRAVVAGEVVRDEEWVLRRPDGSAVTVLCTAAPIRDAAGAVIGGLAAWRDITERKRREALARRVQAFVAALAGATDLADVAATAVRETRAALGAAAARLVRVAPDDPARLEVLASDGFREGAGAPAAGRRCPADSPVPARDALRDGAPVRVVGRDALARRYPAALPLIEGTDVGSWLAVPCLIGRPGQHTPVGALGLAFAGERALDAGELDFALEAARYAAQALERARLYEAERAARARAEDAQREAEAANRAKGDFLANMSHELRTPLNAIGGYAQLMEMGLHGPVTDDQRLALGRVQAAGRHLLGLINDVLNYAKLESGAVEYALAAVDLREVLAATAELVEPQRLAKRIAYAAELPAGEAPVWADRDKLVQVLLNLLSNAVKFTPAGGRVALDVRADGDMAVLTVADTGIGIPADRLDAVFAPFVQVDSRRARAYEGTGLGLTISRDLARGMGGDLTVTSEEGRGSTFSLALRRADGDAGSPTERRFRAERRRRRRDMRRDPPRDEPDRRSGEDRRGGE